MAKIGKKGEMEFGVCKSIFNSGYMLISFIFPYFCLLWKQGETTYYHSVFQHNTELFKISRYYGEACGNSFDETV